MFFSWKSLRSSGVILGIVAAAAATASAQTGPRIIDTGRTDLGAPLPPVAPEAVAPAGGTISTAPADPSARIVLKELRIEGALHLDPRRIDALWEESRGKTIALADIRKFADAIGALYRDAGFALYAVAVPQQSFADGIVTIRVVEGYVDAVAIEADDAIADFSLLKAYAARIVADRPLHQAVLERYVLLMNAIPGLTVGSKLEPIAGKPGATTLRLAVKRKRLEAGLGIGNQGTPLLARTQLAVNAVANSLFREGDRTQLVYGFPPGNFDRYRYLALFHQEPLGEDGLTLAGNVGYLHTLTGTPTVSGDAVILGLHLNDPIIRGVHQSLIGNIGLDALDSDNALLGTAISDERTRALRASLVYTNDDFLGGAVLGSTTLSEGLPGLGARRGSIAFGGPSFTKLNLRLERGQNLPAEFVFRLRATGQYSGTHLPASEQFAFGGDDFGRAFYLETLNGDRALAASAELAHKLSTKFGAGYVDAVEVFGFGDWGKVWNVGTLYQPAADRAASAGFGIRATLRKESAVQLEAAVPIERPIHSPSPDDWRLVFSVSSKF